ncbi:MAG: hypothetical protein AB7P23_12485 [Amphiplicatus sp.]
MCAVRKHVILSAAALSIAGGASAHAMDEKGASAGGVAIGESRGGVTDRAYISAPPNFAFVVEREPGSFLDCGEGMDQRIADKDGRDLAVLSCGVTLTETIVIPAAAESARLIVHF